MRRRELRRLLNATVCSRRPGEINYYQGLHDIAAVLLFVAGERPAAQMLARMAVCHLRDCTRCVGIACISVCIWAFVAPPAVRQHMLPDLDHPGHPAIASHSSWDVQRCASHTHRPFKFFNHKANP